MFNKVVLVGNLTKDITLREVGNAVKVGNSSIAATRKFSVGDEKREETCFIDITFFGRQAEVANQYLKKGSKVLIEGRLKLEQWQDSDGNNRSKHSISVESMEMLGGNKEDNTNNNTTNKNRSNNNNYNKYDIDDEIIPF